MASWTLEELELRVARAKEPVDLLPLLYPPNPTKELHQFPEIVASSGDVHGTSSGRTARIPSSNGPGGSTSWCHWAAGGLDVVSRTVRRQPPMDGSRSANDRGAVRMAWDRRSEEVSFGFPWIA